MKGTACEPCTSPTRPHAEGEEGWHAFPKQAVSGPGEEGRVYAACSTPLGWGARPDGFYFHGHGCSMMTEGEDRRRKETGGGGNVAQTI